MQRQSRFTPIKIAVTILAAGGWLLGTAGLLAATGLIRQSRQLEELNSFLLADVVRLQRDRGAKTPESGGTDEKSRFFLERKISELKNQNLFLQEKMDELYASFQKQMKDVLDAKLSLEKTFLGVKQNMRNEHEAVRLGILSLSKEGASFQAENGSGLPAGKSDPPVRIVSVDGEGKFVVVDAGKLSGLEKGLRLSAFDEGIEIALLEVIESRDRVAACRILTPAGGPALVVGQEVRAGENR